MIVDEFKVVDKNMKESQAVLSGLVDRAAQLSLKVGERWQEFYDASTVQRQTVSAKCTNMEFERERQLQTKMEVIDGVDSEARFFTPTGRPDHDMEILEKIAKRRYYFKSVNNIAKVTWYAQFIIKFREVVKVNIDFIIYYFFIY